MTLPFKKPLDSSAKSKGVAVAAPSQPKEGALAPPRRIMLVEDNAINRKVVSRMLERTKRFVVDTYSDGKMAVEAVERKDAVWDAVLKDIYMPVTRRPSAVRYASFVAIVETRGDRS